ncbi:mitochondrial ribonuclease P protein 1 [Vespula squamosa]|uniref:RNA (guanine-9-)-methyltransferase domain-containing protein 1 n=1 Tax=Vespula squamosa TaxID=30214 RepID=A0ABD2C784_VESSQ
MYNFGLRNSIILFRNLQSVCILSSPSNTNLSKIQITRFIKRNISEVPFSIKRKEEIDKNDNELLQKLLEDSVIMKKYKLLQYEIDYMREMNETVPKKLRPKDWLYLLNSTKTHQRKYIRFLFINEIKKENTRNKHLEKMELLHLKMKELEKECPSGLKYGLGHNSLFLRIYNKSLDEFLNFNLSISAMFEPNIVFDCGYSNIMTNFEIKNCAKQLLMSFVRNRMHKNPSQLYLCNASKSSAFMLALHNLIPNLYDDTFPLNITSKSYLDIFDKDKLVYLTPHCRNEMTSYDPDKIYIIGAIVDKTSPQPYSLAKAKKEGLYMEKLPLDRYLQWNTGSTKSLTLNQVLGVLIDVKYTKNWMDAFDNNIPRRKIVLDDTISTKCIQHVRK